MGSRYEGEKAISLDTSPPQTPLLPAQTFFQGQWRSSWHASPSPADRLRRLFPSACTPPIFPRNPHPGAWRAVCAWLTDARRLRLLLGPFSCRFPSCRGQRPVSCHRPSPIPPFPPSVAAVTRGLAFPFEARISNAFPLPPKIRTTRKAGGLLWPCKGLLPAAPKDAGFHAVQAQCPCRLGYPLKGS